MKDLLNRAICYEEKEEVKIEKATRPLFHLAARVGWMNDPNGFTYYNGKYHLFYQYYPYDTKWGPMHWGHAVSADLISWTYLPTALAPDESYDNVGCFSGSAIELPSGEQLLLYTGVKRESGDTAARDIQTQCIAVGDGQTYKKYENNPVISQSDLPENASMYDFRDPKIWFENGSYYCVAGSCTEDKDGQILLYRSTNGFEWAFEKVLIKNNERFGKMWECPDFFPLDGKQVLIISPQEMLPVGLEFHNGNGTMYIAGSYDAKHNFHEECCGTIDYGMDFYAPQTVQAPDGRRIMIGWMQNWDTLAYKPDYLWFGQMSIPREISLKNGRLYQLPVREIEGCYGEKIAHNNVRFSRELNLPGIQGRCINLELNIQPLDEREIYRKFEVRVADNGTYYTSILYDPYESTIELDRKYSGTRKVAVHQRRAYVKKQNGKIKLRILLDKFSMEVFVNDGEQALSMTFYTDIGVKGINFFADNEIIVDAEMHVLSIEKKVGETE